MTTRYVSVIGPGDGAKPEDVAAAAIVGRRLAEHGVVVVTGGLGGVMEAAASGAAQAAGLSVGLVPGPDRAEGSSAHSVLLPTGLGEMRNALVVRCADVVVALGSSWGTESEIALAVRTGVPVVVLGEWPQPAEGPVLAMTVEDALAHVFRLLARD